MGDLVLHRVRAVLKQPQLALNALEVPPLSSNPNANPNANQNANQNSKRTSPIENVLNDLPERKRLKSASGELTAQEKIEIMKEIEEKKTSWGKLTSGAKTFRSKFLTPATSESLFFQDRILQVEKSNELCRKWSKLCRKLTNYVDPYP
jgi:hypothetical protein